MEEDHLQEEADNLQEKVDSLLVEEDNLQEEGDNLEEEVVDHHNLVEEATPWVPLPHRQQQEHLQHIQGLSKEHHQCTLWANAEQWNCSSNNSSSIGMQIATISS